jgi:hypothetical protein
VLAVGEEGSVGDGVVDVDSELEAAIVDSGTFAVVLSFEPPPPEHATASNVNAMTVVRSIGVSPS